MAQTANQRRRPALHLVPAWEEIRPDLQHPSIREIEESAPVLALTTRLPLPRIEGVKTAADIVAEMDEDEIEAQRLVLAMYDVRANHWVVEAYLESAYWQEVYRGSYRHIAMDSVRDHDTTRVTAHTVEGWTLVEPIEENE